MDTGGVSKGVEIGGLTEGFGTMGVSGGGETGGLSGGGCWGTWFDGLFTIDLRKKVSLDESIIHWGILIIGRPLYSYVWLQ